MKPDLFLRSAVNYLDILRALDEGVIITDRAGRIMFINNAQARIDGVDPEAAIGKTPPENWDVTAETSPIMDCLKTRKPLINEHKIYRTASGRRANTINSVFPLWSESGQLIGSISFVREYNLMEETLASIMSSRSEGPSRPAGSGARYTFNDLIGQSPDFREALKIAKMAASTPSPVMIHGQTGTGKELFAQSIHNHSHRRLKPFVGINCAAIPENLLEGVLFGTARGAFTGALDRPGLVEKADGGTLFLDEINAMPPGLQAKLLRVIQEMKVRRVGALEERPVDLKLISSVNEDPHRALDQGRLRTDLFYRLAVVLLHIPPLKDRPGDLDGLVRHFIEAYDTQLGRHTDGISPEVDRIFKAYDWPGNVRELEHAIAGALNLLGRRTVIGLHDLPRHLADLFQSGLAAKPQTPAGDLPEYGSVPAQPPQVSAEEQPRPAALRENLDLPTAQARAEKKAITQALTQTRGNVTQAGYILGLSRQRLAYRMKKLDLTREKFNPK